MRLERRHPAQQTLVLEMRPAPLHGFLDVRTGRVNRCAQMRQDGLRKGGRLGDIGVNAVVDDSHGDGVILRNAVSAYYQRRRRVPHLLNLAGR
jgi:hypothetical protein